MANDKDFKVGTSIKPKRYLEALGTVVSTSGSVDTLNLATGSVFNYTPTASKEIQISNPATSGTNSGAVLLINGTASGYTTTYHNSIKFSGGTAPTSPANGETDLITLDTTDGGTTYLASHAIDGAS